MSTPMRATAQAQPNIALIKYWGKNDETLIIPATSSISVTLNEFPTTTTVEVQEGVTHDCATLNGVQLREDELGRIRTVLSRVRELAGSTQHAKVTSLNTIPTAAGLASSASGFAALASAAATAYGLDLSHTDLSRLARRGSGSASRSVFGGIVKWHRGYDDETSFAQPLGWKGPELAMVIGQLSTARKAISSRKGMTHTVATSPFYQPWVESNEHLVHRAEEAIHTGDLATLGELTELSTMRMHATMLGAEPPIRYLTGRSFDLFDAVAEARATGFTAYATADAGPNVKILTTVTDLEPIRSLLAEQYPDITFLGSRLGEGAKITVGSAES